jgi:hypothetical protein
MATGRTPWPKSGDGISYSDYKHQKGEKVIAITDNHGYVVAPVPVAPVNETDMVLFPEGLKALQRVAKEVGLDLRGAYLNLDGGFDSAHNRTCIFNERLFNAAIHASRLCGERTVAWEDKLKRLLLRCERIQQRHYGMKSMAYTLINLRAFWGA